MIEEDELELMLAVEEQERKERASSSSSSAQPKRKREPLKLGYPPAKAARVAPPAPTQTQFRFQSDPAIAKRGGVVKWAAVDLDWSFLRQFQRLCNRIVLRVRRDGVHVTDVDSKRTNTMLVHAVVPVRTMSGFFLEGEELKVGLSNTPYSTTSKSQMEMLVMHFDAAVAGKATRTEVAYVEAPGKPHKSLRFYVATPHTEQTTDCACELEPDAVTMPAFPDLRAPFFRRPIFQVTTTEFTSIIKAMDAVLGPSAQQRECDVSENNKLNFRAVRIRPVGDPLYMESYIAIFFSETAVGSHGLHVDGTALRRADERGEFEPVDWEPGYSGPRTKFIHAVLATKRIPFNPANGGSVEVAMRHADGTALEVTIVDLVRTNLRLLNLVVPSINKKAVVVMRGGWNAEAGFPEVVCSFQGERHSFHLRLPHFSDEDDYQADTLGSFTRSHSSS